MHRLIDTQTSLLRHLTSPAFIFGTRDLGSAGLDSDLQGMDIRRLRLEAEFSYSKRMTRIRQTFGRTRDPARSRLHGPHTRLRGRMSAQDL